jgi:hypothetical protein
VYKRDDLQKWLSAIKDELKSLNENKTWIVVQKPNDVKVLSTKWLFKIKEDEYSMPFKYKARLVARGFLQKWSVDYNEPYAPVAKHPTIRTVLAVGLYHPYRELIGNLMYLMLCSGPDICYAVGYLARFQEYAGNEHWVAAKRVLRYLKSTIDDGLLFGKKQNEVVTGYVDSDWASCKVDRKSVTGYVFKVYGNTVVWASKKQTVVALSSAEAEYIALSASICEAVWLKGILEDLGEIKQDYCINIYEDNMGCIGMATTTESKRAKHIDIKHHFIRDKIASKEVKITKIPSSKQLADILTKALDKSKFMQFKEGLLN